jgi:hypothetical protein
VPGLPLAGDATMLEALQAGIAGQLAVPDDASAASARQAASKVKGRPFPLWRRKQNGSGHRHRKPSAGHQEGTETVVASGQRRTARMSSATEGVSRCQR